MSAERLKPLLPIIGVIGLVAIWSFVTWQKWVDPVLLPSPIATAKALWAGMNGGAMRYCMACSTAQRRSLINSSSTGPVDQWVSTLTRFGSGAATFGMVTSSTPLR